MFFFQDSIFIAAELIIIISFLFRDILFLRLIYVVGQLVYIAGAFIAGMHHPGMKVIIFFSLISCFIHIKESVRIIYQRIPVKLPLKVIHIYRKNFQMMTTQEFLKMYQLSSTKTYQKDTQIAIQGELLSTLKMLKQGRVLIIKDNNLVTTLEAGFFIGEMSFLQSGAANATVLVASNEAEFMEWDRPVLDKLKVKDPELYIKFEQAIALNLIRKLDRDGN